jgi:phosphatidylglycerophosphatase A
VACIVLLALRNASIQTIAVITAASFIIGWIAVVPAERLMIDLWGKRKRHTGEVVDHDFNETNIDEFHGQFVAALPIWYFHLQGNMQILALFMVFLLFRVCDTEKPWPISQTEKRFARSAFGIMVDDTLAGGMAAVIMGIFIAVFGRT